MLCQSITQVSAGLHHREQTDLARYDHPTPIAQWVHQCGGVPLLAHLLTYLKHHITNAVTEGLNSKIQSIKSAARGFRNFKNYRTRILFFCGKLNLYPL